MLTWTKIPGEKLILSSPVNKNRAKRLTQELLREKCKKCTFRKDGNYDFEYTGESYAGVPEVYPFRNCSGVGKPESKC